MTVPLARPVRFPEDLAKLPKDRLLEPRGWPRALAGLGGRRAGKPAACADCLQGTTLYFGSTPLCDHHARMRALKILTKEAIEAEVVARTYAYIDERNLDRVKDYPKAHHAVLDDHPALKLAYAGVGAPVTGPGFVPPLNPLNRPADVEGPRHQPTLIPDPSAERARDKWSKHFRARFPEIADEILQAQTGRDIFEAVVRGLQYEDPSLGPIQAHEKAKADPDLRQAYFRS